MIGQLTPEVLRGVPLFENLTHADLQPLLAACEIREYPADVLILRAGESEQALYVVLEGEAEVRFETLLPEGESVGRLYPRSVFGESSFFHPAPHHANVVAIEPTTVLRLGREAYDRLMVEGDKATMRLAAHVASILARRLQATDEWVVQMLREREDQAAAHSWRRFRSRIGSGIDFQSSFMGFGAHG